MLIRAKDERGMAMVTVILAMLVIVTVSAAAFQLSVGNLSHSAYDRKRDQALQAAQTAVDSYIAALPGTTKVCNGVGSTYTLSTSPSVTYQTSVAWSTDGNTFTSCPTAPAAGTTLTWVVVTGTGSAGTGSVVARKWQTLVQLTAIKGGGRSAYFGNTGLCIANGPLVLHNVTGNDAMLYSGGDINTTSLCGSTSSGNMVIEGNVYAQGSIDHMSGCVEGNVWAGGSVNLNSILVGACSSGSYSGAPSSITGNSPPNPTCDGKPNNFCYFLDTSNNPYGNVTAVGGSVTLSAASAFGMCKAGGSQSWSSSQCSPNKDGTGFAPAPCMGTVGDGTANCGSSNVLGLAMPPTTDMLVFTYNASDWSPAYAVVNESSGNCGTIATDIANKIAAGVSGNYNLLFYINPGCALNIPNNTTYNLKGNTIIVTTGSFSTGNLQVTTSAGTCNTNATDNAGNPLYPNAKCQFDVIVPTNVVANPTASCVPPAADPGTWDITYGNTTNTSGVDGLNYTPCWLNVTQSSNISGQGIAGVVDEANNFKMVFHPLTIPGFSPTGYQAAPAYFRECVPGSPYC